MRAIVLAALLAVSAATLGSLPANAEVVCESIPLLAGAYPDPSAPAYAEGDGGASVCAEPFSPTGPALNWTRVSLGQSVVIHTPADTVSAGAEASAEEERDGTLADASADASWGVNDTAVGLDLGNPENVSWEVVVLITQTDYFVTVTAPPAVVPVLGCTSTSDKFQAVVTCAPPEEVGGIDVACRNGILVVEQGSNFETTTGSVSCNGVGASCTTFILCTSPIPIVGNRPDHGFPFVCSRSTSDGHPFTHPPHVNVLCRIGVIPPAPGE